MKCRLAAFAIATSLAPGAHANDALEAKVRAYAPVYAILNACDLRAINAAADDNRAMLEAVKSDPDAKKLLARVHSETQAAYRKARDAGDRHRFCKDFIAANSQNAKARVTAVAEGYLSGVNARVRDAIGHDICKQGDPVKLSKADRKDYETMKRVFQVEQKVAREIAQEQGWNATEETTVVTEQFCAAVNNR